MVASTVGELSALLAANLSDEQAQRLGLDTLLPLRRATARRCSASIPPPASPGSCSVLARCLSPRCVDYRYSVAAPAGADGQRRQPRRGVRASSANAVGAAAARPSYLFGVLVGRHLSPGIAAACASAAKRWPSSACWIRWPPETQNWAEKEANGLDPEVLAEIDREREAFLAAQRGKPPASCSALSKATMPMRCGC